MTRSERIEKAAWVLLNANQDRFVPGQDALRAALAASPAETAPGLRCGCGSTASLMCDSTLQYVSACHAAPPRPPAEGARPEWMPGGAHCDCGCVEFMVPSVPCVRVASLHWDGKEEGEEGHRWMEHTPTRCRWLDVETVATPAPAPAAPPSAPPAVEPPGDCLLCIRPENEHGDIPHHFTPSVLPAPILSAGGETTRCACYEGGEDDGGCDCCGAQMGEPCKHAGRAGPKEAP